MANVNALRQKHPQFVYRKFSIDTSDSSIQLRFDFLLEPDIVFTPTVSISANHGLLQHVAPAVLDNFAFHVGLIELISYWKAACPKSIVVSAGSLTPLQAAWWKTLLVHGLCEFFYRNDIDFRQPDFVTIAPNDIAPFPLYDQSVHDRSLVLIGGGKDSIVTLKTLQEKQQPYGCLVVNPTPATAAILQKASVGEVITVNRTIDQKLLALNGEGYLNGHTPFSAYLAFMSTFAATLFGYRFVIVSNEHSSNEGNIVYRDTEINHQYSKTFAFESLFRDYCTQYLTTATSYFSFLRPLYEIQIARMFSRYQQFFPLFKSCNVGRGTAWCGTCPKCLFVYLTLAPFIERDVLLHIFGTDIFAHDSLLPMLLGLSGKVPLKPFECVGTREETIVALYLTIQKYQKEHRALPLLLHRGAQEILATQTDLAKRAHAVLESWNTQHFLPAPFEEMLKHAV